MKKMIIVGGIILLTIIGLGVYFAMPQINEIQKNAYINNVEVFVEEVKVRHETSTKSCINWKSVLGDY
jgi:hypothetical protein